MRAISRRPNSARRKKAPTNALSFCEIAYYSAPATRIMRHVRYWKAKSTDVARTSAFRGSS
jgi:hypothetical protein